MLIVCEIDTKRDNGAWLPLVFRKLYFETLWFSDKLTN